MSANWSLGGKKMKIKTHYETISASLCCSLQSTTSPSVYSVPSSVVNWPEKLLIVVLTACSQTGHYTPQPCIEWVCVGGCVKIWGEVCTTELETLQVIPTGTYVTTPLSSLSYSLPSLFFSCFHIFSQFDSRFISGTLLCLLTPNKGFMLNRRSSVQQMARQEKALTVTLWFWEIALAQRGKGSTAMGRLPQCAAEINHILCQRCKQKVDYRMQVYQCK